MSTRSALNSVPSPNLSLITDNVKFQHIHTDQRVVSSALGQRRKKGYIRLICALKAGEGDMWAGLAWRGALVGRTRKLVKSTGQELPETVSVCV